MRDIRKVRIFDPSRDLARAFAQEARDAFDLDIEAAGSPSEALREADIVCTATTSPAPVFTDGDLRPGRT